MRSIVLKMFETEDWDLDQDFLNDVDDKALKFYSQADKINVPTKKRKVEISDDIFDNNTICSKPKNVTKVNEAVAKSSNDKISRKDMILQMFNKNVLNKDDHSTTCSKTISNQSHFFELDNIPHNDISIQSSRRNVVLNILQNKDLHGSSNEGKQTSSISSNSICIKKCNKHSEINVNANQEQNNHTLMYVVKKNKLSKERVLNEDIFPSTSDFRGESLPSQVCDKVLENTRNIDKHNVSNNQRIQRISNVSNLCFNINKEITEKVKKPSFAMAHFQPPQPCKKTSLVRQFPGPAGLIPDNIDGAVSPISYINSLNETENIRIKNTVDSNFSVFCSQNTENLFTEGAWQSMLDDLPVDFLHGYEISTIKQIACINGFQSTKIEILAGVMESIDHSHENPPIVLKDFTDSIQGIVHGDIPLKYPGTLEPNVVLLLHDVGLLRISGALTTSKYHILISPASLLCIYSSKRKTLCSPQMQSIIHNIFSVKSKLKSYCPLMSESRHSANSKSSVTITKQKKLDHEVEDSRKKVDLPGEKQQISKTDIFNMFEDMNQLMNFDDVDDFVASSAKNQTENQMTLKPTNIADQESFGCNRGSNSITEFTHTNDKVTDSNIDVLFRGAPLSKNSKISGVKSSSMDHDNEAEDLRYDDNDKKIHDRPVRSKLLQFKNGTTRTPISSLTNMSRIDTKVDHKSEIISRTGTSQDMFRESENDSDDEMLSQLDVDTIFSDYDKHS